jgi:hypothetical protein
MRVNFVSLLATVGTLLTACGGSDPNAPASVTATPGVTSVGVQADVPWNADGAFKVVVPSDASAAEVREAKARVLEDLSTTSNITNLKPDTRYDAYAAAYIWESPGRPAYVFLGRRYYMSTWVGPSSAWTAKEMVVTTSPGAWVSGVKPNPPLSLEFITRDGDLASAAIGSTVVRAAVAEGDVEIVSGAAVEAVNGVAMFSDLAVSGSGPFTLRFAVEGEPGFEPLLQDGTLGDVVKDATQLVVASRPASITKDVVPSEPFAVELHNANGDRVAGTSVDVRVVAPYAALDPTPLLGKLRVTAVDGRAVFDAFRVSSNFAGVTAIALQFEQVDTGDGTPLQSSNVFYVDF